MYNFNEIFSYLQGRDVKKRMIAAWGVDDHTISAASQAVDLGLTCRKQKDIVTAHEITDAFREIFPDDPCLGDFALFGYGVTRGQK